MSAQLQAARRYIEVGQPHRALDTLAELDGETAMSPEALRLRGYAHYGREDFDAAAQAARDGLDSDPQDISLLFLLSLVEEQRGNLAAAERAILAALELHPEDPQLLCQYADLLMRDRQFEKAERLVEVAAGADPESPDVLAARLSLAYLRNDDAEARRLSEQMLSMDPESVRGHRMLGALDLDRGRAAAAAQRLGEAVRLTPGHEGTAMSARAAREYSRPMYFPLRFMERLGVAGSWVAAMVVIFGLRAAGLGAAAAIATLAWITICVWSWIASAVLNRRLRE